MGTFMISMLQKANFTRSYRGATISLKDAHQLQVDALHIYLETYLLTLYNPRKVVIGNHISERRSATGQASSSCWGSFLSSLAGHNISEAAAAGCVVLTGPHVGHFYMLQKANFTRSCRGAAISLKDAQQLVRPVAVVGGSFFI